MMSRSISTTCRWFKRFNSGRVSAPRPGPISTILSAGSGRIAVMMSATICSSTRKFWPNFFLALCMARHLGGELARFQQAAAIGLAASRQLQCRTVVHRSTNDRQAEGDVHALPKTGVLEHGQTLIVIHREHA